jgi:hypothetical protein
MIEVAPQKCEDRLADRQAATRKNDKNALTRVRERVHLPACVYLIKASI